MASSFNLSKPFDFSIFSFDFDNGENQPTQPSDSSSSSSAVDQVQKKVIGKGAPLQVDRTLQKSKSGRKPGPQVAPLASSSQVLVDSWHWPSDHLPNVATFNCDGDQINLLTQNVLDEKKSSPRKPGTTLHGAPGMKESEKEREIAMAHLVVEQLENYQIVTLQECSPFFKKTLAELLQNKPEFSFVADGECLTLFNQTLFSLQNSSPISLGGGQTNCLHVMLKKGDTLLRIINVHLPNSMTNKGLSDDEEGTLSQALVPEDDILTLIAGDTNLNADRIKEALSEDNLLESYQRISQDHHTTAIRPGAKEMSYNCSCIDHILIKESPQFREPSPPPTIPDSPILRRTHDIVEKYALPLLISKLQRELAKTEQRCTKDSSLEAYLNSQRNDLAVLVNKLTLFN